MAGKSTRITVDLGSDELVKSLRIAAVEQRRTVRDIVVEALEAWLGANPKAGGKATVAPAEPKVQSSNGSDYKSMMETLNRYRGVGGA